jgi:hypothetical protein
MKHFLSALASSVVLASGLTTGTHHAWAATDCTADIGQAQYSAQLYLYIYDTGDTNHRNTTHTSCPWQGITNSHVTQTGLPATHFSGGTTV